MFVRVARTNLVYKIIIIGKDPEESPWWLPMAGHIFGTRTSAIIMMMLDGLLVSGMP